MSSKSLVRALCGREDSNLHPSRDWDLNPVNAIFAWLRLVPDSASELAFREIAVRLMSACTTLCGDFGLQNGCSRAPRQRERGLSSEVAGGLFRPDQARCKSGVRRRPGRRPRARRTVTRSLTSGAAVACWVYLGRLEWALIRRPRWQRTEVAPGAKPGCRHAG